MLKLSTGSTMALRPVCRAMCQCISRPRASSYRPLSTLLQNNITHIHTPTKLAPPPRLSRRLVTQPTLGPDVNDVSNIINPVKAQDGSILRLKISQRAAQKLNSIKIEDNNPELILRISVESGGCHGFQYLLSLKDQSTIDKEDCVFERDGAKFVIDQSSLEILQDSTVDYSTELIGSQFKVVNSPHTTSSCGCGSSFDLDFASLAKKADA